MDDEDVLVDEVEVVLTDEVELLLDEVDEVELALVDDETGVDAPTGAVGTVDGCSEVFQVAVVGQAVVATVGEVVPYGVGPGMTYPVRVW